MTAPVPETDDAALRARLAQQLTDAGALRDPAWARAVRAVARHRFVPGFYLAAENLDVDGLTVWEPPTEAVDRIRWLTSPYTDQTLITQFDSPKPSRTCEETEADARLNALARRARA